jgi:hypothetical protein
MDFPRSPSASIPTPPLVETLRRKRERCLATLRVRRGLSWVGLNAALGFAAQRAMRWEGFAALRRGDVSYPWAPTSMEYFFPLLPPSDAVALTGAPSGERCAAAKRTGGDAPFMGIRSAAGSARARHPGSRPSATTYVHRCTAVFRSRALRKSLGGARGRTCAGNGAAASEHATTGLAESSIAHNSASRYRSSPNAAAFDCPTAYLWDPASADVARQVRAVARVRPRRCATAYR